MKTGAKKFVTLLLWVLIAAAAAGLIFIAAVYLLYRNVYRSLTAELGTGLPSASAFLTDGGEASYLEPPDISLTEEGDYELRLKTGMFSRPVTLFVRDTLAPCAEADDLLITVDEVYTPEQVLRSVDDASPVALEWIREPAFGSVGIYETAVRLTDAYGNTSEVPLTVTVVEPSAGMTLEAGEPLPEASAFLATEGSEGVEYACDLPDTAVPGSYEITVSYEGIPYHAVLTVEDTVPPEAELRDLETHTGYPLDISDFIVSVSDVTPVSWEYVTEPDWTGEGEQEIRIRFLDGGGNETVVSACCTLLKEYEAPQLWGVADRYCYVGESVAYFSNVYAVDNYDAPECISVTVDKSAVNPRETGTYPVTYTATDRSGNSASKTVRFTFLNPKVSEEELDSAAEEILSGILTEGMTETEQAYAVFCYVYDHINYVDSSNYTDWQYAAYHGFTTGTGDCFTYYACSYVLLNKLGLNVISIKREDYSYNHHYWCLLNLGTGWYHFDPTNFNTEKIPVHWAFMRTTSELYAMRSGTYFWSFDKAKYPAIETKPFVPPES